MMVLANMRLIATDRAVDIRTAEGKITTISKTQKAGGNINFRDAIAFPGLINSHDHLDFNLFPQLGDRFYQNYVEWAEYIHKHYKLEINEVLAIPQHLRARWGIYKNLLCGVTTVVNHGDDLKIDNPLINVFTDCQNLHSVALEKKWKLRLNNPKKVSIPAVIHVGEGLDVDAYTEINSLLKWNLLKRNIIGVHGVAITTEQTRGFKALVWCPQSNYFLLDKTASVGQLKKHVTILFGTDSTLTAGWDIWEHIRLARKTGLLTDGELFKSLTTRAADVWKLDTGELASGKDADLVIARDKGNWFATTPADILMVVQQGNIRLFDVEMIEQVISAGVNLNNFSKVFIGESCKYVAGDLPALMDEITSYCPTAKFPALAQQYAKVV